MSDVRLIIFGARMDSLRLKASQREWPPEVTFFNGTGPEVSRAFELDALIVTSMQAERFGATLPFPDGEAVVIGTPDSKRLLGFPPFIIAGVSMRLSHPRRWRDEASLLLTAGLRAIREFNIDGPRIQRVGVLADNLLVQELGEDVTLDLVEDAVKHSRDSLGTPE